MQPPCHQHCCHQGGWILPPLTVTDATSLCSAPMGTLLSSSTTLQSPSHHHCHHHHHWSRTTPPRAPATTNIPWSHGHSPATTTCYHHYWHCHRHSGCDEDLQHHQDITSLTRSIYPWACYLTCQFPHLQRGHGKSVHFTRLLGGFKELVCGRCSEESLAHDKAKYIGCHTTPLCATATINTRPIPIARTIWSPSSLWWSPSAPHHNPTVPSASLAPERRTGTARVPSPGLKSMHWWPPSRVTGTPLGYPLISHGALGVTDVLCSSIYSEGAVTWMAMWSCDGDRSSGADIAESECSLKSWG